MIGIDVQDSTLYQISVSPSAAVFSGVLPGGFYEIFADEADIYVKNFASGEATGSFSTGYPIWAGNSARIKVSDGGKIGFICKSGQPTITVEYMLVHVSL